MPLEQENINTAISPPPSTPPPTPTPDAIKFSSQDGKKPLFVVDGKMIDGDLSSIDSNTIESVTVLKDAAAVEKYGEKAKEGLIEITLKKGEQGNTSVSNSEVKVIGYGNQKADPFHTDVRVVGYGVQKIGDWTQKVVIRNTGFNNYSSSPLVIVDGVESGINIRELNLSPNDIESVTVFISSFKAAGF